MKVSVGILFIGFFAVSSLFAESDIRIKKSNKDNLIESVGIGQEQVPVLYKKTISQKSRLEFQAQAKVSRVVRDTISSLVEKGAQVEEVIVGECKNIHSGLVTDGGHHLSSDKYKCLAEIIYRR